MRKPTSHLALALVLTAAAVTCGGPEYGIGQGQPAYPARSVTGAPRLPLQIGSVFVAQNPQQATSTRSANGYLLIVNSGTTAVDFSHAHLSFVSTQGSVLLDPAVITALQTPLAAGQSLALGDAGLASFCQHLQFSGDQAAIVDNTFVVQAYLAWGAAAPDAATAVPALTTAALQSGAIAQVTDNFVTTGGGANQSAYIVGGTTLQILSP